MKLFRHYLSMLLILLISCNCFAGSPTSLASISLAPNPQQDFCAGSDILVQFSVNEAANAGNVFTVQLSDATGSFANPVTIGSIASVTSSSFNATIPLSTVPGTGYHIRIVSSSPVVISNEGPELSIYGLPSVTIEGFGSPVGPPGGFCAGVGIFLTANVVGTVASYQWKLNGSDISGATQSTYHGTVGGDYTVVVTNPNGCSVESDIFLAFELSNPQGQITGSNMLCPGGTIFLSANTITGTWYLNGNPIPDIFSSLLTVTMPGDYQWLPHTISGCSGTLSPVFTVTFFTASFTGLASTYLISAAPVTLAGNPAGGVFSGPGITGSTFDPATAGLGGPYTITYTYQTPGDPNNPAGCTVTATQQTTVTGGCAPPLATITTNGSTTFCNGGSVLLFANTGTGLSYQWKLNGNIITGATNTTYNASSSGNYTVVVSNAPGCSTASNSISITAVFIPQGAISVQGNETTLCPGGSTVLMGNTSDGRWYLNGNLIQGTFGNGLGITTPGDYQWQPLSLVGSCVGQISAVTTISILSASFSGLAGNYLSNAPPVTLTGSPAGGTFSGPGVTGNTFDPAAAGVGGPFTITYSVTHNSFNPPFTCTATSTQQTTVTQGGCTPPPATIAAAGPTIFCGNGSVTLNANTGTGLSYQWQIGTVNISGANASSFVASISGNYTVVVSNAGGCSTTSSPVNVTSNPLPSVSFSGLANIYPAGAPAVTLTANPSGGTFSGPGILGNTFDPALAGVGGPYTITYTYTNANGCTNTTTHQTNVGSVCPVPNIPGSISSTDDGTSVCPGDVRTYTILPTPGAISYTWTAPPGANITGGQGSVTATLTYDAGFTAGDSLRVTANNSCGSSIPRARKINRKAAPSSPVAISGPVTGICNMTGILYSVIQQAGNTYNWSWNTGAVSIVSGQGTNEVASDFTTSFITGKISVTASNTCGTSTPRNLIVNAKPDVPGTISGLAGVCANQQAVAYSISPVNNATSYIWYAPTGAHINDGTTTSTGSTLATTATNVQVNFSSTGGLVRVKGVNACTVGTVTSLPVSVVCKVSLHSTEIATEQPAEVYPNPSSGHFRITLPFVSKTATAKIEIVNQFGQIVYQGNQQCSKGMINLNLNSRFANGIYIISCIVDGQKTVTRLMISK